MEVIMGKQFWKPGNMLYPVPAVMVSCARTGERPNIITVAWAGTVCSSPVMVSISVRPERYSYSIMKETGEFVINLVTRDLVYAADYCGVKSGRDTDKFLNMKLTPVPMEHVSAPGIGESPVNIECRITQILKLGSHDMFLADIVSVDVEPEFIDENGALRLENSKILAYCHGKYYQLIKPLRELGFAVKKKGKGR